VNRRHLVLVALTLLSLSLVTGAGSVSSVSADRDVSVAVVEDEEAYLGIELGDTDWSNRTRTLEVTNRASTRPIEVTASGTTVTVGPGEAESLTVSCGTVDLTATGPDVAINATRSVDCEKPGNGSSDDRRNNGQCSNSGDHGKSGESGSCGGGSDVSDHKDDDDGNDDEDGQDEDDGDDGEDRTEGEQDEDDRDDDH
jgi:hypothetical protein